MLTGVGDGEVAAIILGILLALAIVCIVVLFVLTRCVVSVALTPLPDVLYVARTTDKRGRYVALTHVSLTTECAQQHKEQHKAERANPALQNNVGSFCMPNADHVFWQLQDHEFAETGSHA